MDMDDQLLSQKYEFILIRVASSTQISKATNKIISSLRTQSPSNKQVIVALRAPARLANKLITIVEIAKRELGPGEIKCFQYNSLHSDMVEIARKPSELAVAMGAEAKEDESEEAFETMGTSNLTGRKKRAVPVMTTYLSTAPVRELQDVCG